MQCSTCRHDAVIFQPYSGQYLCRDHFIRSVESRVRRDIRRCHGIRPGDHIGVAQDGGLPARTLLFFLEKLTRDRKNIRISALPPGISAPSLTRIAVATTLEESAASVLAAILRGYTGQPLTTSPAAGPFALPQITPFSHIPAGEIALYGRLGGITGDELAVPQDPDPFLCEVKSLLAEYTKKHPAAPHAVLNLGESLDTCSHTRSEEIPHGA